MSRLTARQLLNIKRAPQKDLMEPVSQPDSRLNLLQPPTADHMSESDYQSQHPASHRTVTVLQSQRNFYNHRETLTLTRSSCKKLYHGNHAMAGTPKNPEVLFLRG